MSKNVNVQATEMWQERERARTFLESTNRIKTMVESRKFYLGKHWAKHSDKTKHMPRPVFNYCKKIADHKISNICGSPVKINFVASLDYISTTRMTKFYDYMCKELKLSEINEDALTTGAITGTYIEYFYYDEKCIGKKGNYEGALRVQLIDPSNFYVANPYEKDVQRQKWIMFETRLDVDEVKNSIADKDVVEDLDLIAPDEVGNIYDDQEQEKSNLCTVLIKFFRRDGEVYYQMATKNVLLTKAICSNPRKNLEFLMDAEAEESEIDTPVEAYPSADMSRVKTREYKAVYYPVVVGRWDYNGGLFYGKGEVEDCIENNKAINREIGMRLYDSQLNGFTKVLVKNGALKNQEITDEPGQVITDHTPGASWGIQRFESQSYAGRNLDLANSVGDLLLNVNNAGDVITGDTINRDLSGTAISQLQAQANKPIEKQRKRFWRFKEEEARIMLQFFLLFYDEQEYTYEMNYLEKKEMDDYFSKAEINTASPFQEFNIDVFKSKEFENILFEISLEAGAGTQYSEMAGIDILNNLYLGGAMQNLSSEYLEQFIELAPDTYMPFKSKLKEIIAVQKESELSQAKEQISALQEQIAQLTIMLEEAQNTGNEYKKMLNESRTSFDRLKSEAEGKINQLKGYSTKLEKELFKSYSPKKEATGNDHSE